MLRGQAESPGPRARNAGHSRADGVERELDGNDQPGATVPLAAAAQGDAESEGRVAARGRPPSSRIMVAAGALVVAVMAGVYFVSREQSPAAPAQEQPGFPGSGTSTAPLIDTAPATTVPVTSSIPASTTMATTTPASSTLNEAKAALAREDLLEAARLVSAAPPGDSVAAVRRTSQDVMDAASSRATAARKNARDLGRTNRPRYLEGEDHLKQALAARQAAAIERAVKEYLAAADRYEAASQPQAIAALTSIPVTIPVVTTSSVATTSAASTSTSVVTTSIRPAPALTLEEAQRVLDQYRAAYRAFDLTRLRATFPTFGGSEQTKVEAYRKNKDFSWCDYDFSNYRISQDARVDVEGKEICKPVTRQPAHEVQASHHVFDLKRTPTGSWVIVNHS